MMNERPSRRDLLRLLKEAAPYVLGASAFGGMLFGAARYRWGAPVDQAEVNGFEEKFGIRIFNPALPIRIIEDTVRQELGIRAQNGLISKGLQTLVGWRVGELSIADETLEQFPPCLCTCENGRITLGIGEYRPLTGSGLGGFKGGACVCAPDSQVYDFLLGKMIVDPSPPVIIYSERDVFPGIWESDIHPKMVIVHELVHMYQHTFDEGDWNPLVKEALRICGADSEIDIREPCGSLAAIFSSGCVVERSPEDEVLFVQCREGDRLGIIGQSPVDLVPVASELYFAGKERMYSSFARVLGAEKAGRFCQFIKEQVFGGREYRGGFSVS